ncbi:MAG: cytochrome c family protein [Proteobacteria bacterium]|nr:cytochrome c family protein [Pseudomonadota bacterium]
MILKNVGICLVAGAAFLSLSGAAQAAGDPTAGKSVFARCAICHTVVKGGPNGIGPNIFGVVGRKAGSAPNFNYSAAMKSSGITWMADKLDAYITHPGQTVPGNRMAFAGISNAQQRADVIAYLQTLK